MSDTLIKTSLFDPLIPFILEIVDKKNNQKGTVVFTIPEYLKMDKDALLTYFDHIDYIMGYDTESYPKQIKGELKSYELFIYLKTKLMNTIYNGGKYYRSVKIITE